MNITMKMDDELVKKARKIAMERNTTLSELIRSYLRQLTSIEKTKKARMIKQFQEHFKKHAVTIGPITWKREDLYDR